MYNILPFRVDPFPSYWLLCMERDCIQRSNQGCVCHRTFSLLSNTALLRYRRTHPNPFHCFVNALCRFEPGPLPHLNRTYQEPISWIIAKLVKEGRLREYLHYRINVLPQELPELK